MLANDAYKYFNYAFLKLLNIWNVLYGITLKVYKFLITFMITINIINN